MARIKKFQTTAEHYDKEKNWLLFEEILEYKNHVLRRVQEAFDCMLQENTITETRLHRAADILRGDLINSFYDPNGHLLVISCKSPCGGIFTDYEDETIEMEISLDSWRRFTTVLGPYEESGYRDDRAPTLVKRIFY